MKKLLLTALALIGFMSSNAQEATATHSGKFYSHFTDAYTPCTVTQYDDGTWSVDNAYGYEGLTMSWYVSSKSTPMFRDNVSGNYAYYTFPGTEDEYGKAEKIGVFNEPSGSGFSAVEATTYNGTKVWWQSFDSAGENWGVDAIYWGQPDVLATHSGTYENALEDAAYDVTIDELSNGLLRINAFYGYEGYDLYIDLSGAVPAVANAREYDEAYTYAPYGWVDNKGFIDDLYLHFPADNPPVYTSGTKGKVINLPVAIIEKDLVHTDVIKWGAATGISTISEANDAESEYFNLQGVRVANPEKGLYIKVQGDKVYKVIIK